MPEAWYAVYTKFQHEKNAAGLLASKNVEVFLPVYRAVHRWKDRSQMVILPLFPCYAFVRMNLERSLEVLRTAGVRWLVESAGHACPIPDAEIEAVRNVCATGTRVQPHPFLKIGDMVRVRAGALAGMEGILVRTRNQCRVVITVELLQRSVAVEVELSNVEPLVPRGEATTRILEPSRRSA